MSIEINATDDRCITQFAPVGALAAYYQQQKVLEPFQSVVPPVKKRDYPLPNQLTQVLLSIFTGCEYLSLVNSILLPECSLAQLYRIEHFADASTLSRTLAVCRRGFVFTGNVPFRRSFWPKLRLRAPFLPRKRRDLGAAFFSPTAC